MRSRRLASLAMLLAAPSFALTLVPLVAHSQDLLPVVNVSLPTVTGAPVYRGSLLASPGTWDPADVAAAYSWLRDGTPIAGATADRYSPTLADIGHRLAVRVTASKEGYQPGQASSDPTARVTRAQFVLEARPTLIGVPRFQRTLAASAGSWSSDPGSVRYQWLRNGQAIDRAHRRRHRLGVEDVGERVSVRVTVRREGYRRTTARSRAVTVLHRVPLRRTATYVVATRGRLAADAATFARLAQQTYDDPRGWRSAGIGFRRVPSGGDFTLVLSEAALVPSFSSGCSAEYSCRVGRYVIINQTRWLQATPTWRQVGGSLRDYRNLVVNHETGHWLGKSHSYCPGSGHLAPVMMQQSKGLNGCRANPWPLPGERNTPRYR